MRARGITALYLWWGEEGGVGGRRIVYLLSLVLVLTGGEPANEERRLAAFATSYRLTVFIEDSRVLPENFLKSSRRKNHDPPDFSRDRSRCAGVNPRTPELVGTDDDTE